MRICNSNGSRGTGAYESPRARAFELSIRHADLKWVQNAGSVFVGEYAPQSMGDYVSGPNHVLPTGRVGRVRGGLSVMDFVKVITVQQYTHAGLKKMGPHAIALAEAEGLKGHAKSVRVRDEMSIATNLVTETKIGSGASALFRRCRSTIRRWQDGMRCALDFNENTFAPSPRVMEKLRAHDGRRTDESILKGSL